MKLSRIVASCLICVAASSANAHTVKEETERLRMVIGEQAAKFETTLEEDHSRMEAYAVRIELNVIKRLEAYATVWSENHYYSDDALKAEYARYQNCYLAAEELITYSKGIVRVMREDLKDYDEQAAIEKYHGHLIECDAELGR